MLNELTRDWAGERLNPSLNSREVLLDLYDRRSVIEPDSSLQVYGQASAMHPEIFQGLPIFQPCVPIYNQINCTRHDATHNENSDLQ